MFHTRYSLPTSLTAPRAVALEVDDELANATMASMDKIPVPHVDFGCSIDELIARASRAFREGRLGRQYYYENVLYLNPSDSLTNITQATGLQGASILTIAGSGDFPLAFAMHSPKSITAIDISPFACALTELKVVAAQMLSRTDFWRLFGVIYQESEGRLPIFDWEMYQGLKPYLSEESALIFEMIQKKGADVLGSFSAQGRCEFDVLRGDYNSISEWSGSVRFRGLKSYSTIQSVERYPWLKDEDTYATLRGGLRQSDIIIGRTMLSKDLLDLSRYDLVYLSNAFQDPLNEYLESLFMSGARRIVVSGYTPNPRLNEERLRRKFGFLRGGEINSLFFDPNVGFGIFLEFQRRAA